MLRLTPKLVDDLNYAAKRYGDDKFFGVRSKEGEFFLFNWVLGLRFAAEEIMNCDDLEMLEDETDRICSVSETKREVVRHIHQRGWMDILVGTGLYQDVRLVQLQQDERHVFEDRGWDIIPFETDGGRKFYVREAYFDAAEETIGDEIHPVIFRPIISGSYVPDYRPMLLQDGDGDVRGLVSVFDEENLRNPTTREKEYEELVEDTLPEFYRR